MAERERGSIPGLWVAVLTTTALAAFAANSILCRLALGEGEIDPYSFTAVRLGSGATALALILGFRGKGFRRADRKAQSAVSFRGAAYLLVYALPFSLAYVRLKTGTGALLLFATVQMTMIGYGIRSGVRLGLAEWIGLAGALAGTTYLLSPGLTAPDPVGAAFMILAGAGWGVYSILGKGVSDPLHGTALNFRRSGFWMIVLVLLVGTWRDVSPRGFMLAVLSGALASGLGYTIWYAALTSLPVTRAALVQLAVPVLAAAGGVVFMDEAVTPRMVIAGVVTLTSIAIAIILRDRRRSPL